MVGGGRDMMGIWRRDSDMAEEGDLAGEVATQKGKGQAVTGTVSFFECA